MSFGKEAESAEPINRSLWAKLSLDRRWWHSLIDHSRFYNNRRSDDGSRRPPVGLTSTRSPACG